MRPATLSGLALAFALAPRLARADDLAVVTLEHGTWAASVAALQNDLRAEGSSVHVRVQDPQGRVLACGDYALSLDDVSSRAFDVVACDPATASTELRLAHRAALFEHSDYVPRPLPAGISALQIRTGTAAGGAAPAGGSDVSCSVSVRPYVMDLEHGAPVFLTPGRFVLRPLGASIHAEAGGAGWTLRGAASAGLAVEYDVVDTQRGEVVLHDRATLACGAAPVPPPGSVAVAVPVAPASLPGNYRTVRMMVIHRLSLATVGWYALRH